MAHHVHSWTAACQNASCSSHTPTLQLSPNPLSTGFPMQQGLAALCSSSSGYIPKETGKQSLSKLRSPLHEKFPSLTLIYPLISSPTSSQERQGRGHIKLSPLPKLGRSSASSVHTKQVTNNKKQVTNPVNYSKSYKREEAQSWWILKLRPSDLMQNRGSYHSTTPWFCTAGPESEPEMFEFFNNNKKIVLRNGIFLQV